MRKIKVIAEFDKGISVDWIGSGVDDPVVDAIVDIFLFMVPSGLIPEGTKIELRQTKHADNANRKTGRTFAMCWTDDKNRKHSVIHYAKALRNLPARAIYGILLHELGHAMTSLVDPDAGEEDADMWVVINLPKWADYKYANVEGAHDVEVVSERFIKHLQRGRPHG